MNSNLQRFVSNGRVERSLFLASSDLSLLDAADLLLSALDFFKSLSADLFLNDKFRLNQKS